MLAYILKWIWVACESIKCAPIYRLSRWSSSFCVETVWKGESSEAKQWLLKHYTEDLFSHYEEEETQIHMQTLIFYQSVVWVQLNIYIVHGVLSNTLIHTKLHSKSINRASTKSLNPYIHSLHTHTHTHVTAMVCCFYSIGYIIHQVFNKNTVEWTNIRRWCISVKIEIYTKKKSQRSLASHDLQFWPEFYVPLTFLCAHFFPTIVCCMCL